MTEELPQEQGPQLQPAQDPAMLFTIQGNPTELFKGLTKFRAQVKQPKLDSDNPFFKSTYLSLTGLITAIDEAIKGTGLAYDQIIANYNQAPAVQTIITHESGGMLITKPFALRPTKADPQGIGSATTYARRYQLQALFGIAGEKDDDGNAASNPQGNQGRGYPASPQSPQQYQGNNNYGRGQYGNGRNYQGGQH